MTLPPPPPAAPLPTPAPSSPSVNARLRARWLDTVAAGADTVMERVSVVERLMREGLWHKSLAGELASRWAVTGGAVQRYSAEAKRRVLPMPPQHARAHVEALLEHAEDLIPNAPDPSGAAVKAALAWARLYGLDRPGGSSGGSSGARELDAPEGESSGDNWWKDGDDGQG